MRAYPYERWPRLSREHVLQLRAHARASLAAPFVHGAKQNGDWLGVQVAITAGIPALSAPILVHADAIAAVLLETHDGRRAALLLSVPLASILVDRALGGDGKGLEAASGPLGELERGVLAYVVARWLSAADGELRVAAVLTRSPALIEALGDGELVRWPLDIALGAAQRMTAALLAPARPLPRARTAQIPSWAWQIETELVLSRGVAFLSARELAELSRGDIVLPDHDAIELAGPRISWRARIEDSALHLESEEWRAPRCAHGETKMNDADGSLEKVADTPITLTLELARFVLTLEELARLAPGEVLSTGRAIGERVTLRANEKIVAHGELVDVDGEIGVRILELPAS